MRALSQCRCSERLKLLSVIKGKAFRSPSDAIDPIRRPVLASRGPKRATAEIKGPIVPDLQSANIFDLVMSRAGPTQPGALRSAILTPSPLRLGVFRLAKLFVAIVIVPQN